MKAEKKKRPPPGPSRFEVTAQGLYHTEITVNEDGEKQSNTHWIAPPIYVDARTHDSTNGAYGRLVRFENENKRERTCILLCSELIDGLDAIRQLFDFGFQASDKRKDLAALRHYILQCAPEHTICSLPSHGWHEKDFIDSDQFAIPEGDKNE